MFDIGWQELLLIGIVALVAIGPKEMPAAMRAMAKMVSKGRSLSREFQSSVAEVMREAELDELKRKVEAAGRLDLGEEVKKTVDPTGTLTAEFDPTEFARKLKADVEAGPPTRPLTKPADEAAGPPAPAAAAGDPSGDTADRASAAKTSAS